MRQGRIYFAESPVPANTDKTVSSVSWFRLFEMKEVHVAAGIAGNDQIEGVRKCTAIRRAIAGDRLQRRRHSRMDFA
jgi:hypothetical protein